MLTSIIDKTSLGKFLTLAASNRHGHSTTVNVHSTILHTACERGRVNLIFSPHLAGDVS